MARFQSFSTKVYWRSDSELMQVQLQAQLEGSNRNLSGWVRDIVMAYIRNKRPDAFTRTLQTTIKEHLSEVGREIPDVPEDSKLIPHPTRPGLITVGDLKKEGLILGDDDAKPDWDDILNPKEGEDKE